MTKDSEESQEYEIGENGYYPPTYYQCEDAIYYDDYGFEENTLTREEQLKILEDFDNQKPLPYTIEEVYPGTKVTTVEELQRLVDEIKRSKESMDEDTNK